MRLSAACLTLLFILSLSIIPTTHAQMGGGPPPAQPTQTRYYLQSGEQTTVRGGDWHPSNMPGAGGSNTTVFNMDTPTPQGSEVACSWCDFATRPLVGYHSFKSFKLHLYVRWPTNQCVTFIGQLINDTAITYGIGSAASDFSAIVYQYRDYSNYHIMKSREVTVVDMVIHGFDVEVGQEVRVGIGAGKRLDFHFGMTWATLGSDNPCWIMVGGGMNYMMFPTILFGDAEHASYIEMDEVGLQGVPVPEFPSFLIMLPVILALAIVLRREQNRRLGRSPK